MPELLGAKDEDAVAVLGDAALSATLERIHRRKTAEVTLEERFLLLRRRIHSETIDRRRPLPASV